MVGAGGGAAGPRRGARPHARAGAEHAEVVALREAGTAARDATLYVNLEPCSHFGRTAPCVRAVIEAGYPAGWWRA